MGGYPPLKSGQGPANLVGEKGDGLLEGEQLRLAGFAVTDFYLPLFFIGLTHGEAIRDAEQIGVIELGAGPFITIIQEFV